jgi:O-antigen/teichoic acid export membrane protein
VNLRALLRGSLLYTIGNFLPRIGAFLLLPIYTAAMGPDQFGTFSLMLSVAGILGVVYRLGLDGALMRLHFDVAVHERPSLYLTLTLSTAVVGAVLSVLLAVIAGPFFERLFAGAPFWPFGPLTLLLTFLLAFQYVPSTFLRASQLPGRFLLLTAGGFGVVVAATVYFVVVLDLGAVGALLGQIASAAVVAAMSLVVLVRLGRAAVRSDLLARSLHFGLPLLPHSLSAWVLNLSDRWLIGLLTAGGPEAAQAAVGVYSFGYVLGQVVSLVAFSFNAAWVPFFYERGEQEAGSSLLREMTSLSTLGLAALAVGIGLLAPELTALLASEQWGASTAEAARVTPVVAFASVAYGVYFMVVSAIFLRRRVAVLPLLTIVAGVVNVALNVAFIPRFGIMAAAWATLAGYGTLAILTTWYARRVYPLDLDLPRVGVAILGSALVLAAGTLLTASIAGTLAGAAVHLAIGVAFAALALVAARGPVRRLRSLAAAGSLGGVG